MLNSKFWILKTTNDVHFIRYYQSKVVARPVARAFVTDPALVFVSSASNWKMLVENRHSLHKSSKCEMLQIVFLLTQWRSLLVIHILIILWLIFGSGNQVVLTNYLFTKRVQMHVFTKKLEGEERGVAICCLWFLLLHSLFLSRQFSFFLSFVFFRLE